MAGAPPPTKTVVRVQEEDDTVVVFTSDHGDCLGDHHLVYKFSSHYDSVAKVPLVFAGPGVKGPGVRDQLVELIDLGPTLLDLVGLPPLDGAQGISMRSLIEGGSEELHDAVFSEQGQRVMVRTREWKMVAYLGESFGELYHLAEDPDELCNLYDVADCGGVRGDLAERLLPVLDACDLALGHGTEDVAPIHAALVNALAPVGLEILDPVGEPFDPTRHEAVLHEPAGEDDAGGTQVVVEVLRRGYVWSGRVLRPAMVKVRG